MNIQYGNNFIELELKELFDFVIGGDWGKDADYKDDNYSLAYCIRGSEFRNWKEEKGKTASLRKIKTSSINTRKLIEGDLIVEISGGGPEQPVGRTVLIDKSVLAFKPDIPKISTNFLRLIRPTKHINANYLNLFLTFFYKSGEIVAYQGGSNNLRNLKFEEYSLIKIPIPPLAEQHRIVAKIEELFSSLDKAIESINTAKEQLKVYRQAVLKWAFEGRFTNDNVKDGELPKGWEWLTISDLLVDPKKGMATGPFGTALKKEEHKKVGVPVLGIENIGEGIFKMPNKIFVSEAKADELKSFKVQANDIIISRSGTVGEICCVPKKYENALISTNLIRVRLNQKKINSTFFVYLFQGGVVKEQVKDLCKGSTRAFLNQTILNSLDFPYCEPAEQLKIVSEIESRLSVCDKIEEGIENSLLQAEALRQSILKRAFEGKLVPQDPNDEPASKLIERIKAERAKSDGVKVKNEKKIKN